MLNLCRTEKEKINLIRDLSLSQEHTWPGELEWAYTSSRLKQEATLGHGHGQAVEQHECISVKNGHWQWEREATMPA